MIEQKKWYLPKYQYYIFINGDHDAEDEWLDLYGLEMGLNVHL